jgi:filamentous hemagglutinin family protein
MSAIAIPVAARAQTLPADTTPTGGNVTAGAATITNGAASTVINQTSQRTAINWQTFNVGSNANVTFVQPNSSSVALNRVLTPSPSIIAGHIDANGQLVLVNQSGVVFTKGSEVNAESLVVATSNISDSNFMAGRMVFDGAPNPGAKIVNDGKITVHDTGLVGLIAPQVENRGIITARLGQVVLAGASAFTLDMYGDRLMSIDVTKAVRAVEVDGKLVPALVTNSGLIVADGGKITLTAQDADALVTQLIDAGGTIRANSVGNQAGAIDISGVGGNISIAGNLLATGKTGGTVHVQADAASIVSLSSTAKIDASGATGGGTIALGTSLARAAAGASDKTAAKSGQVLVAPGATLKANAKTSGTGGLITLLSADDTDFAGAIFATGGTLGGAGGNVEISGDSGYQLTGPVDVTAAAGAAGRLLIDPGTLVVATGGSSPASGTTPVTVASGDANFTLAPSYIDSFSGTLELEAGTLISVTNSIVGGAALSALLLQSPTLSAAAGITLSGASARLALVADTLSLVAAVSASTIEVVPDNLNLLVIGATGVDPNKLDAASLLRLGAYTPVGSSTPSDVTAQGVSLANGSISSTALEIDSNGTITQASGNSISVTDLLLDSVGGPITLAGAQTFATLTGATSDGGLTLNDTEALKITGAVTESSAAPINISATTLDVNSAVAGNNVTLGASAGTLGLAANVSAATALSLSGKAGVVQTGGSLTATTLGAASASGNVQLTGTTNNVGTLAASSAAGTVSVADSGTLAVAGIVAAPHVSLSAAALKFLGTGTLAPGTELDLATGALNSAAGAISFSATGGTIALAPFAAGGTLASAEITLATGDIAAAKAPTSYILGAADGITAAAVTLANPLSLSGDTVELTAATSIALAAGASLTAGTVELSGTTGTNFSEDSTAEILASLFGIDATGGTFGNVIAPGTANAIGTVSGATAGTLALVDTGVLTLAGALNFASLSVSGASTLDVTGSITAASGLSLAATTLVSDNGTLDLTGDQAALLLSAPTVTNSATITASGTGAEIGILADTLSFGAAVTAASGTIAIVPFSANSVIDVGAASAAGTLGLNAASLTSYVSAQELLLGSVDGTAATNTSTISIDGTLGSIGETIGLFATSLVTQTAVLKAGTLIGAADMFALDAANVVGALGSVSAGSTLSFADGGDLTLAGKLTAANLISLSTAGSLVAGGTLAAPSVTLSGTDFIGLTGSISAGTALDLMSGDSVSQASTAALTVGELDGAITTGNASFSGTNSVGTIGSFTVAAGDFALSDSAALTLGTALEASNITLAAASLALGGTLSVASFLSLTGTAGISQAAGATLTAPTLALDTATSISTGIVELGGSNNLVGTLAGARSTGGLTLTDTGALDVTGALSDRSTAASAAISLTATSLTLGSLVSGEAVALDATTGAITQASAGTLSASTLSATAASGIALANAANSFGVATGLAAGTGSLGLKDAASTLTLAGAVTAGGDVSLAVAALAFGAGGVITPGGNLALAVDALGSLADSISFASAASVALAPFTAAGTVAGQVDALLADLTGTAPTSFTIGSATAAAVTLSGTDNFGTALVDLVAAGSIAQTAGSLTAGTLELSGTTLTSFTQAAGAAITATTFSGDGATTIGNIAALGTANSVSTLGAFPQPTTASLAFLDTGTLSITNALDLAGVTLSAASTLNLDSNITAATLVIGSGAYVSQGSAGVLNVTTLLTDGSVGGNILLGAANSVGTLGNVALTGSFYLANTPGLTLAGTLAAGAADLQDSGAISQVTGGAIQAATLSAAGTDISLLGPGNSIGTLGSISATGSFGLSDDEAVTVSAPLSASSDITLSDTVAGGIRLAAASAITAAPGAHTILLSASTIAADAGFILSAPGGTIALASTGAAIDLGGTMANALDLSAGLIGNATASLLLIGNGSNTVYADDSVTASNAGAVRLDGTNITLAGSLDVPGLLDLVAANAITLASGKLTAATLALGGSTATRFAEGSAATISAATFATDGSTIGNISAYAAGNTIGTLGVIGQTAGSTLAVKTAGALDVTSALSDAVITLTAGSLTLNAEITATSLTALGGGTVTQAGGTLSSPTLVSDGAIASDVSLALAGNRIGTLGNVTLGGNLTLNDGESLLLAGFLDDAGGTVTFGTLGVSEASGGSISAGTLADLGAATSLVFGNAGNDVSALTPLTLTGDFVLNDGTNALTLLNTLKSATAIEIAAGTLSAPAAAGLDVATGGTLALAVGTVSGLLAFSAPAGTVALGPDIAGGTLDLTGLLGILGSLGSAPASITLGSALGFTADSISLSGPTSFGSALLDLVATGAISLGSGATLSAGALELGGTATTSFVEESGAAINLGTGTLSTDGSTIGNILALGANTIGTLGLIAQTAGSTLAVASTGALDVSTDISAAVITLSADTLSLVGNITATSALTLGGGSVTQTGSITTPVLSGTGTGNFDLGLASNSISTLAGFSAAALTLGDTAALTLSGLDSLSGTLDFTTLAGGLTQAASGTLDAATLLAATALPGNVTLVGAGGNAIGTLSTLQLSNGTLDLASTGLTTLTGPVSAADITLNTGTLSLDGNISAANVLEFAGGGVSQTATGTLTATTLAGSGTLAGDVRITTATVGTIAGLLNNGTFVFVDTAPLTLAGRLGASTGSATLVAPSIALLSGGEVDGAGLTLAANSALGLALAGSLQAGAGELALLSLGTIQQDAGATLSGATLSDVGTLFGTGYTTGGSLSLSTDIGTLGNVTATTLYVADDQALDVAGNVTATTGSLTLADAQGLTISGSVGVAGSNTLALSTDTLSLIGTTPILTAGEIEIAPSTASDIVIGGAADANSHLAISLAQLGALSNTPTLALGSANGRTAAAIFIAGTAAVGETLALSATTLISQTAGTLGAGAMFVSAATGIDIAGLVSAAGALVLTGGTIAATGTLQGETISVTGSSIALANATASTGPIDIGTAGGGDVTLSGKIDAQTGAVAVSGDNIALANVTAGSALTVDAAGAITDAIGTLDGARISLSGTSLTLGADLTATGSIGLTGTGSVTADGALAGSAISISGTGIELGGSLSASGALSLTGSDAVTDDGTLTAGAIAFTAAGFTQSATAGIISAGSLAGTAASGDIQLDAVANRIGTLGALTATLGSFSLTDGEALTLTAPVSAGSNITIYDNAAGGIALSGAAGITAAAGNHTILLSASNIATAGPAFTLSAQGGTITLAPTGDAIDLGGTQTNVMDLSAGLIGHATASLLLIGNGSNSIYAEGAVTAANAGTVKLDGTNITFAGSLSVTNLLDLDAATLITQTTGSGISAGTLTGDSLTPDVTLTGTANSITTLAGFGADSFDLTDTGVPTLSLAGPLSVTNAATISAASLNDSGNITAANLSLSGTGSVGIGGTVTATELAAISAPTIAISSAGATLTAATLSLGGASLSLGGLISASTLLALDGGGTVTESGATVAAATLRLGTLAQAALTGTRNSVATLAGGTLSGDLSLTDAQALTQTGSLQAANITLAASSIGITGTINAAGTSAAGGVLDLTDVTAGVAESGAGLIKAGTLTTGGTDAGDVSLSNAGNVITTLGGFTLSTGTLALSDAVALTVGGPLSLAAAFLRASGFDIAAGVSVAGVLGLAGSTLPLVIDSVLNAGTLAIGGDGVTETGAGVINADSLIGSGAILSSVDLRGNNRIDSLGSLDVIGGTLNVNDSGVTAATGLTLDSSISAQAVTIAAPKITLAGFVAATGLLSLSSGGAIDETGSITAGTLAASTTGTLGTSLVSGDATLTGSNLIGTLAGVSLTNGTLLLDDALALVIAGADSAAAASITAPGIELTGSFTVPGELRLADSAADGMTLSGFAQAGTLDLESAGAVSEAGTLEASLLTGTATGDVALTGAQNSIATLGDYSLVSGNFTLDDSADLALAGLLTGTQAASGNISLSASQINLAAAGSVFTNGILALDAGSVGLAGDISVFTLALTGAGATVIQTGGGIAAATLTSDGADLGLVILNGGANGVSTLGSFEASNLILADTDNSMVQSSLVVAGPVSLGLGIFSASSITLTGSLSALALAIEGGDGGVTESSSGALNIATLSSGSESEGGNFALTSDHNSIAAISSFTLGTSLTAFDLAIGDGTDLTVLGTVTAGNISLAAPSITLASTGLIGGSTSESVTLAGTSFIELDGAVNAAAVSLASTGAVTESASGLITAGTLTGSASAFSLAGNPNSIGTLGSLTSAGALALNNALALNIAGPVSAASANLVASSFDVLGTLATTGALALATTNGGIAESGAIDATTLTGSVTGGDALLTGTNSIATLGSFDAGSQNFDLADAASLAVAGPVTAANVTLGGANIALNGLVSASSALDLASAGTISEGAGATLTAATLTSDGASDGAVTLASGTNNFGALSSFAAANLFLVDTSPLSVGNVSVTFITLAATSGLTFVNNVSAAGQLVLNAGTVGQTGGSIAAGLLTGAASGAVSLLDGNAVATLGSFTAASLALNDAGQLTETGPLTAASIALSGSSVLLAGSVTGTVLTLAAGGAVTQSAGSLNVGTLLSGGVVGGDVALTAGNAVGTLGNFSAAGNLSITDAGTLATAGTQAAANVTLVAGSIALGSALTTGTLSLAANAVSETGSLAVATLTGTVAGDAVLNAANNIGTLGNFAAGGNLLLADAAPLSINGTVAAGGIFGLGASAGATQTGGVVTAATLTSDGQADGTVTLGRSGNAVPVLGDFADSGNLTLADADALNLAGTISGQTISLPVAGALSQASGALTAALLNASAPGIALTQAANAIAALGSVTTGNLNVAGVGSIAGPVTAAAATLTTSGDFVLAGNASITNALDITAAGGITQSGGSIAAASETLSGSAITLSGTDTVSGTLSLSTAGDIVHNAGTLDAGTLTGDAGTLASFVASTDFGTIGSFIMNDSLFSLSNAGALVITGPLVANVISITTAGQLTLQGTGSGGLFIEGPVENNTISSIARTDSVLATNGAPILATGQFNINAGNSSGLFATNLASSSQGGTLFLLTAASPGAAGGDITFNNTAPNGINAPGIDLVLDAGTTGSITGYVNVAHLEVLGGEQSYLLGYVANVTGQGAAGKASASPIPLSKYQINACPIGSLNCVILNVEAIPSSNPLQNFDITQQKKRRLGRNVQLPGVATHDF